MGGCLFLCTVSHFFTGQSFTGVVLDILFSFWGQKKWSLVVLDRWLPYIWKLASVDTTFVILDKWLTYRGGCLSKFDCSNLYWFVDWIVYDDIFLKTIFLLCSNLFCEMFYLLCCFTFTGLKCFCVLLTLMCLLPNNIYYNGFLQMETQFNMKLQMNFWKRLTEHTCWSVGMWLNHHIKFCMSNNSMPI